jgi:hypothetical protein
VPVGVLLDVGGTLWPDRLWPPVPGGADQILGRLSALLPGLPSDQIRQLFGRLRQGGSAFDRAREQDTPLLTQCALPA